MQRPAKIRLEPEIQLTDDSDCSLVGASAWRIPRKGAPTERCDMRYLTPAICVMSLALGGACTLDEAGNSFGDLDESIADTSSELVLSAGSSKQCEGYTSGGGQRVRGVAGIERKLTPVSGGLYYIQYRISVSAENWKKNIGWNTKRTTQLRIIGVIDNVPCYGFTTSCMGYIPVDLGTGGALTTKIGFNWDSDPIGPVYDPGFYDFSSDFRLTFYGRDGTSCDLEP